MASCHGWALLHCINAICWWLYILRAALPHVDNATNEEVPQSTWRDMHVCNSVYPSEVTRREERIYNLMKSSARQIFANISFCLLVQICTCRAHCWHCVCMCMSVCVCLSSSPKHESTEATGAKINGHIFNYRATSDTTFFTLQRSGCAQLKVKKNRHACYSYRICVLLRWNHRKWNLLWKAWISTRTA